MKSTGERLWFFAGVVAALVLVWALQPEPTPLDAKLRIIADRVEKLEGEMKQISKLLADAVAGQMPVDGKIPPPNPALADAVKNGVALVEGSCLARLAEHVKACMLKTERGETVTDDDRAKLKSLKEECDAGL